jgi:hypothetical protein
LPVRLSEKGYNDALARKGEKAYVVYLLACNLYLGLSNLGIGRKGRKRNSMNKLSYFVLLKTGLNSFRMKHQVQPHAMLKTHLDFYIMQS